MQEKEYIIKTQEFTEKDKPSVEKQVDEIIGYLAQIELAKQ